MKQVMNSLTPLFYKISQIIVFILCMQFDEEMQEIFATAIANQLNVYCREAADNCLTGSDVEYR